jgi:hypothetical protein
MKVNNKIGWQKYEDLLQSQMDNPFLDELYSQMTGDYGDEEAGLEDAEQDQGDQGHFVMPMNDRLMENISMASNFDCWMGHTNFNITEEVLERLNKTAGVEVLKICSRYRFFVGIGKMFDFSEVRTDIEKSLGDAKGGSKNEQEDSEVPE